VRNAEDGTSGREWDLDHPVDVAGRRREEEAKTPGKALASETSEIARFQVFSRQRAVGGAKRSEEDDKARGSTNQPVKGLGTATGNALQEKRENR
jgi:hypothetical protein